MPRIPQIDLSWRRTGARIVASCAMLAIAGTGGVGCTVADQSDWDELQSEDAKRVQFFVNSPSTRPVTEQNLRPSELLVEAIDRAQVSLDACVYGFSKTNVIEAIVRAYYRGVKVRVVGDARHFSYGERGYRAMQEHRIPIQVGNQFHIMHNKFFVMDGRYTFMGTGNITTTGFTKNNNNWILIDDQRVADDFGAEFNQMFEGRFSNAKRKLENGNKYQVGDTSIEVYFSPQEDTMGKMLAELDAADDSILFQIFAFTKDQVGSRFIRKHNQFTEYNKAQKSEMNPVLERDKYVAGILDKSQFHGNGQYHEGYRMISNGVPMRIDANINSYVPGDYQAGGGRLHTKTMILDHRQEDARVLSGSFNWSSAATIANDEVLLVLRGERIVGQFVDAWEDLWMQSSVLPDGLCSINIKQADYMCAPDVEPGDIVISEVHWDGWNGETDNSDHSGQSRDELTNDEFIELYNTTDQPIDLSMWTIDNGHDAQFGFTPGTVIQPKEYFLILDHNLPPFSETQPQRGTHAFQNPDFVLNMANDPRFPRLNLKNSSLRLELRAPQDTTGANSDYEPRIIDAVGDYGPAYAGGRRGDKVYSMERVFTNGVPAADGTDPDNWIATPGEQGGENVTPDFRDLVIATPGQANRSAK